MGMRAIGRLAVVGAVVFAPSLARAAEPDPLVERIVALEKKLATDLSSRIPDDLVSDARAATEIYKDAEGKDAIKDRALAVVGSVAKVRLDDVARAGIVMLGELGDEKGAKYVRGYLRPVGDGKVPPALEATLEVIPKIPDDSLIEPLLVIVDESKNFAIAAKAIDALGAFGASKSKREKVLVELVKSVQKSQPGGKGKHGGGGGGGDGVSGGSGMDGSGAGEGGTGYQNNGQSERWGPLSAALPTALNKLTGGSVGSAQEWFALVKENKSKLSALFVADPPTK